MATTINADTSVGGAVVTGDASGVLGLQAAGNTALTLNSSRAIGVGASPSFGSSGQVLTSAGSSAAPTWVTPSAGAMVLVATYDVTGASTVDIEDSFATYDHYVIKGSNITTGANQLFLQTKIGGSYTSETYASFDAKGDGGYTVWQIYNITNTARASIALAGNNFNCTIYACNLNNQNGTAFKPITGQIVGMSGTHVFYARCDSSSAAVTGIRIFPTSGTFDAGKFYLYGLAKS